MAHHDSPRTHEDDHEEIVTPREARQGPLGWPVFNVLVIGLTLVLLAWAIVSFVR